MMADRKALTAQTVEVGDFLSETLVTDTVIYEVIAKTAATVRVRRTRDGEMVEAKNIDGNPYPVVWTAQNSDETGYVRTLRFRNDGTLRTHRSGNPFRFATLIDGVPARYTDYRF